MSGSPNSFREIKFDYENSLIMKLVQYKAYIKINVILNLNYYTYTLSKFK